jgi:hypothetical protein
MTLDVMFRSIGQHIRRPDHPELPTDLGLLSSLQASDPSEAQIVSATTFLESIYGDGDRARLSRAQTPMSRGQTPMMVGKLPGSFPSSLLHEKEKKPWSPPSTFMSRLQSFGKSPTKPVVKESTGHTLRRPPVPRPSTFPNQPDVTPFVAAVEDQSEYVVLVSMYEVYNDRIFDLLSTPANTNGPPMSTRAGAALQKGLMRRPLLFKNTEMSPDIKMVAGLRKVVCGSYDEAMMVLETGLTERRVAGTGSNSVSSRSHGFFCVEVKKRSRPQYGGYLAHQPSWTGGTMTICDLAGSERARNAKTTGSTLAEAGKINESLMYLGQCLQVMNDCQQEGSKPIVPFRQCKLTELLFSNSFPSSNHGTYRQPQRGIMIVTADPEGDFNATSQILRYSAMAREVTVPRVPSVTSTIVGTGVTRATGPANGRLTPHDTRELDLALHEIARLSEECDALSVRLAEQEIAHSEVELRLQAASERALTQEQEIREECYNEMEERLELEKERWKTAWDHERLQNQEFLDEKLGILENATSPLNIHEDDTATTSAVADLQRENDTLRQTIRALEQELQNQSPTKKSKAGPKSPSKKLILQDNANTNIATNPFLASLRASVRDSDVTIKPGSENLGVMDAFDVSPRKLSLRSSGVTNMSAEVEAPTTVKKTRKLTTRKWDLGDVNDL